MREGSHSLTYAELIQDLFPRLTGGIRWGLDRTRHLLAEVGDPQRSFRTVHVGGTNGKGSVAALTASVLREAGHRTGLYSSPHLCTFRERIQVDGEAVSEAALLAAAERLWPAVRGADPTFFETTTALAFLALADAGVRVAVVEVGLGGRLDSTNVVSPEVVALTNVTLDHVQLLGDTVELVAREKAGIIKRGVPVVTAEPEGAPRGIFADRARAVAAPFHTVDLARVEEIGMGQAGTRLRYHSPLWGRLDLAMPLIGAHQIANAALALQVLELLPEELRPDAAAVEAGFRHVHWPGRFQVERREGRTWVFDVAHNVAGVDVLVATLDRLKPARPLVVVVGVLGDKDWRRMLVPLYKAADAVVLTVPPTAPVERRWNAGSVLLEVPAAHAEVIEDFRAALERAEEISDGGTVVVTGSFHTVGDALSDLGLAPWGVDPALPSTSFAA